MPGMAWGRVERCELFARCFVGALLGLRSGSLMGGSLLRVKRFWLGSLTALAMCSGALGRAWAQPTGDTDATDSTPSAPAIVVTAPEPVVTEVSYPAGAHGDAEVVLELV